MAKKTLVEQIKDTQIELEKVRAEKKQKENQLAYQFVKILVCIINCHSCSCG